MAKEEMVRIQRVHSACYVEELAENLKTARKYRIETCLLIHFGKEMEAFNDFPGLPASASKVQSLLRGCSSIDRRKRFTGQDRGS
ncbi:MAG: hypothetical protein HY820_00145 [Acidobacteria bacterium]|nr:hypothetical protein [Acidobacteriota bacterium]